MRSPSRRIDALRTLTPEHRRAVSDGRARVTRSGRLVATAPEATAYSAGHLAANPNRGKRKAAPTGTRATRPNLAQPDRTLRVSYSV